MKEITAITPQVKDKARCNIYIDGRFYCGMGLETVVKNRLKIGSFIDENALLQMQLESEKNTAFDKALTHLSATRKTEKQIRDFLTKKGYLPEICDYVLAKLRDYDFVNDGQYAQEYAEFAAKKKGKRLIRQELRGKGLSEGDIRGALDGLDEEDELSAAQALAQKYLRGKSTDKESAQKAYRYLLGKGFDFDTAKAAVDRFINEEEYDER